MIQTPTHSCGVSDLQVDAEYLLSGRFDLEHPETLHIMLCGSQIDRVENGAIRSGTFSNETLKLKDDPVLKDL